MIGDAERDQDAERRDAAGAARIGALTAASRRESCQPDGPPCSRDQTSRSCSRDARPCQNSKRSGTTRKPPQFGGRGTSRREARLGRGELAPRATRDPASARSAATPTRRRRDARGRAREVGVGFGRARPARRRPFDAHLPLELGPEEQQRDARVGRELASLAAVVVRVEHEAARVDAPSAARCARPAGPSASTVASVIAFGSGTAAAIASSNHARELVEGIGRRVALAQGGALVVDAQLREIGDGSGHRPLRMTRRILLRATAPHDAKRRRAIVDRTRARAKRVSRRCNTRLRPE